jgi:anti-anti-sigma regulatory factor
MPDSRYTDGSNRFKQETRPLRAALMVFFGEYDVSCNRQWSEELESLCGEPNVIIDFSAVTSLDATCMTEVLRMHARRHENGFDRETVILGRLPVRRLFELHKMQDVVRIVSSLDDAMGQPTSAPITHYAFLGSTGGLKGNIRGSDLSQN